MTRQQFASGRNLPPGVFERDLPGWDDDGYYECPECGGDVSDDEYPECLGYADEGEEAEPCGWYAEEPDWEAMWEAKMEARAERAERYMP